MKASELRIGNLVYNPVQKNNIVVDGGLISTEQHREKAIKDYQGFEPIPLTEEWLLKFGFEVNNDTYNLVIDDYNAIVIYSDFSFGISDLDNDVGLVSVVLKHVHQLQNLYHALTGKELKTK